MKNTITALGFSLRMFTFLKSLNFSFIKYLVLLLASISLGSCQHHSASENATKFNNEIIWQKAVAQAKEREADIKAKAKQKADLAKRKASEEKAAQLLAAREQAEVDHRYREAQSWEGVQCDGTGRYMECVNGGGMGD